MKKMFLGLLIASLVGCNSNQVEDAPAETAANSNTAVEQVVDNAPDDQKVIDGAKKQVGSDLLSQIQSGISRSTCNTNDDCDALPVGHRACGGPNDYLVYSKLTSDEAELKRLADAYSAQEKIRNKKENNMSICQMLTKPNVACKSNTCVKSSSFSAADI
jgi:hypothetical protein